MTLAELIRAIESKKRRDKEAAKEKAYFDYILADLIGRSNSRNYHSSNSLPTLSDVYPSLFDSEEIEVKKQEQKDNISAIRFKQFAQSYNKKFKEVGKKDE